MNVYDFDNTIYRGDSTADFVKWCIKNNPAISLKLLNGGVCFLGYRLKMCSKTHFKEKMYSFLSSVPEIDKQVEKFWDEHISNVKKWYIEHQRNDDVIISASPEFLLKPACERLGIKHLMASRVDKKTGFYLGVNCYGAEKVRRFYENFNCKIDEFYSDSLSDSPLAEIAEKAYFVCDNLIIPWEKAKYHKL